MDVNSGVVINPAVKAAKIRAMLQVTQGTPVFGKVLQKHLALLGSNFDLNELTPKPQEAETQQPQDSQELPPMAQEETQLSNV